MGGRARGISVGDFVGDGAGRTPIRSERAAEVARWFGMRPADAKNPRRRGMRSGGRRCDLSRGGEHERGRSRVELPAVESGTITYVTGPSGGGKSSLLRAMCDANDGRQREWIDMLAAPLPDRPVVDCFEELSLRQTLGVLSRVGLAEAWSYLRTPAELSDGQRWRLRLALGFERARQSNRAGIVLACDEFGSLLDRITAMIAARSLRRAIDANPSWCAIVATAHDDLSPALKPDRIAICDFERVEWKRAVE